jgi:hypothetical protein
MRKIANELFNLRKLIQTIACNGKGQFKCLFDREGVLEAVKLGSCEARLAKKMGTWNDVVVFRRNPETTLSWNLYQIAELDRSVWLIEEMRKERTFTTEELARKILSKLKDYYRQYKNAIRMYPNRLR